jgi:hypothetical protein
MSESKVEQGKRIFKFREGAVVLLMLLPLFFFSPGVQAQSNDPERDLSVKFKSEREGKEAGSVVGTVKNNSTRLYSCVRIEFDLMTRFDQRSSREKGRHLGVLAVEVLDLQPGGARDYREPLPFPAGFGLKSVGACPGRPSEKPPTKVPPTKVPPTKVPPTKVPPTKVPPNKVPPNRDPAPVATCSIKGKISGKLKWDTKDDRGQPISFTLKHMYMRSSRAAQPVWVQVRGRDYVFENVPAGKTYVISPGSFRSQPRERTVQCRSNVTHRGIDFKIIGAPSSS